MAVALVSEPARLDRAVISMIEGVIGVKYRSRRCLTFGVTSLTELHVESGHAGQKIQAYHAALYDPTRTSLRPFFYKS